MNLFVTWRIIIFLYIRLRQVLNLFTCHKKRRGGAKNSQELSLFDHTCCCVNLLFETIFETKKKKRKEKKYLRHQVPMHAQIFYITNMKALESRKPIIFGSSYWFYRQPIIAFSLKRSKEKMASILVAFDSFSWQLKHIQWWSSLAFDLARDVYFLIPRNPGIY